MRASKHGTVHPEQGFVNAAGQRGRYFVAGSGRPIVLLSSMIVGAPSYAATLAALARSFRVLVLEMPGSGRGSRLATPWAPIEYVRWLRGALDALSIARCTLIGHSNSGAIALLAGAHHPERVEQLVVVDSIGGERSQLSRLIMRRNLDSWFEPRATPTLLRDGLFNGLVHGRNLRAQIRLAATFEVEPWAARVQPRVLLAWGGRDRTLPLSHLQRLRAILPRSEIHVSPSGRHDWLIEYPDEFAGVVARFVEQHPAPVLPVSI